MEQKIIDDYVSKMDVVIDKMKGDFISETTNTQLTKIKVKEFMDYQNKQIKEKGEIKYGKK